MKKKLKISDLTVSSFVTSLGQDNAATIKGGATEICLQMEKPNVPTDPVIGCDPRETFLVTNCGCSGMYPSLNMPCATLDNPCTNIQTNN